LPWAEAFCGMKLVVGRGMPWDSGQSRARAEQSRVLAESGQSRVRAERGQSRVRAESGQSRADQAVPAKQRRVRQSRADQGQGRVGGVRAESR